MKRAEVEKLKPVKGKDVKGGSTKERTQMAKKMDEAMEKKERKVTRKK